MATVYAQTTHSALLLQLAEDDNSAAWQEFCVRYGDLIRGVARQHGLQAADADDVLQDVLVSLNKAMRNFSYDRERGRFRSYLRTMTIHALYARLRQKRGEAALPVWRSDTEPVEDDAFAAVWETEWRQYHLRQAMRTIEAEFNEPARVAFARYGIDGEDVQTVAHDLGLSRELVYQIKSRVLRRLGELVAQQIDEEG